MPQRDTHTDVFEYPLPKAGVNFYKNPVELRPDEAVLTQNLIWRNGLVKRGGQTKWVDNEVVASKRIVGGHRFYKSDGTKQTLAAAGTTVKYWDGAAWSNVKTGLTDAQPTTFATWLDRVYIANGTNAPHKWDGSADSAVGAAPATTVQFLPYQDRLLSISGGDLTWSSSYDDTTWETVANCGVRPDTKLFGMAYHCVNNSDSGYEATVLLAGANGMYLFKGRDLRIPATTGDYSIYSLALRSGCNAPKTMVWTPKGTIFLANDKMVYLLSFSSTTPTPIGQKITSYTYVSGIDGIEDTPSGQIENACAVYHDGFYKLSITEEGTTNNNIQWWLDVNRLHFDEDGHAGPWYGPMKGQKINVFIPLNGAGDAGELLGGEADTTKGGYIYTLGARDAYADDGTAIETQWWSYFNPLGSVPFKKEVHKVEAEMLDVLGTVSLTFNDITGTLASGYSFGLSGSAVYWDDYYWDEVYWSSSSPTRRVVNISPAITPRRLAVIVTNSSSDDKFELYALRVEAKEQALLFA